MRQLGFILTGGYEASTEHLVKSSVEVNFDG